jgi:hypothetical protein
VDLTSTTTTGGRTSGETTQATTATAMAWGLWSHGEAAAARAKDKEQQASTKQAAPQAAAGKVRESTTRGSKSV